MPMELESLKSDLIAQVDAANDSSALEDIRVKALGKKGALTSLMRELGGLDPEARKARGEALNRVKEAVVLKLEEKLTAIRQREMTDKLASEGVDITLPVRPEHQGALHPITQTTTEITRIFAQMGFNVAEGPDIEDDWYNFTALNIPEEHPARQMHDTFYLPPRDGKTMVLRTHTSPVQIRTMQTQKPPIRMIAPGRTYRSDSDQTHTPMFHQIEGLLIDESTHFGHLKGCVMDFLRIFFALPNLKVRFRPSFFPFTEPSAEVDIGCRWEKDQLILGEGNDWLEIMGCGMVHPKVLAHAGIDAAKYQGFAFGMGIERLAMLKYGIPDLRTFFDSDLRWLRHYGFSFAGEGL